MFKIIIVKLLALFGIHLSKRAASAVKIEGMVPAGFFGMEVEAVPKAR